MSVAKDRVLHAVCPPLPQDIVENLLDEYQHIKQQFVLRRFQPSELNGGRFSECVLRLIQHLDTGTYTPFGTQLNSENIVNRAANSTALHESFRFFIPRFARSLLDVRNRRNVAHVGGDVNPNLPDALLICHCADWVLTEIIRHFHSCSISIEEARSIVLSVSEVHIPVIADVDGFVRVQNTALDAREKTLVVMYHKHPSSVKDSELAQWIRYSNLSRYKSSILAGLDREALIHYQDGLCTMLPKGVAHVEVNIPLDLLV